MKTLLGSWNFFWPGRPAVRRRSLLSSIRWEDLEERVRLDWLETFIVRLLLPLLLHVDDDDDCSCLISNDDAVDVVDDVKEDRDDTSNENDSVVDGHAIMIMDAMPITATAIMELFTRLTIILVAVS